MDKRFGLVAIDENEVRPLGAALNVPDGIEDPLLWLITQHDHADRLTSAVHAAAREPFDYAALTSPIVRPPKIIAAPVNYLDHKIEMSEQKSIAEYGVFLKASTSVIGPNGTITLPYSDKRTDQEGELGVVIGRAARGVSREDALDYVFGYCCVLDITVRSTEDRSTRKSFDTFTPLGPWITTRDEVSDPGALDLQCWVGDERRQAVSTGELLFDVPLLIEYASSVMTLEPGDVIATGTPAGVRELHHGDAVKVAISGLGELRVVVDGTSAIPYSTRPGAARFAGARPETNM